ncbi:hypothetical protein L195_g023244 [Trifolium pratense]|uniref:Integrase catalytic domain-containing protein n=1 Tax=Trifolium pratense TaxID=57577 RepID=A0A2K3NAA0_TRIPR|nr:hypothetical protein L195_g023244 [Trifolium pratense]
MQDQMAQASLTTNDQSDGSCVDLHLQKEIGKGNLNHGLYLYDFSSSSYDSSLSMNKCAQHQFSCPHRPQQNSVVERKHQQLLNVARALLFQSKISLQFWGECIITAVYLINKTPSVSLQGTSPYELLFQSVPDYSLRVFGCLAYASTIPAHRHKFSPRATPCVFMGYPTGIKGYRLFDPVSVLLFFSPTVIPQPSSDPSLTDEPIPAPLPDPIHDPVPDPLPLPGTLSSIPQTPPAPVLRRSSRPSKPPAHLDLYDCNSVTVTHPIQSFLTYDHLSPSYMAYISQVSSFYEPQFNHQAIQYPEWQQAVAAELVALESNNTWTVMPLPAGKEGYRMQVGVQSEMQC